MRQYYRFLCAALLLGCVAWSSSSVWAADDSSIRSEAKSAFSKLTKSSIAAVKAARENKGAPTKGLGDLGVAKFNIESVETPDAEGETNGTKGEIKPSEIAVKVWFELPDGTFVNPVKHRWSPKERFYIHIEAAAPIYVALLQIDSETGRSTQVYPSKKYENSFKSLQAGRAKRLPVLFAMDDDDKDEQMSLVVVRADWIGVGDELTKPATESVETQNGRPAVTAELTPTAAGTMKSLSDSVISGEKASPEALRKSSPELSAERSREIARAIDEDAPVAKFQAIAAADDEEEQSCDEEDVCFYMFGEAQVGQWTLTIKK